MTRLFSAGGEELYAYGLWSTISAGVDKHVVYVEGDQRSAGYYFPPRTGFACYRLELDEYLYKALDNKTEVYFGFGYKDGTIRNDKAFFRAYRTAMTDTGVELRHETNDTVRLYRTNTAIAISENNVLTSGMWHYIEVRYKPLNSGGVVQVKVDGTQVINYSGDTTDGNEYCTGFQLYGNSSDVNAGYFDDIVVNDTAGGVNDGWPGMVRLLPVFAQAAGDSTDLTRAGTNLGANFAQVRHGGNEFALVQGSTPDDYDLYQMDAPDLPAGATVKNVILQAKARVQAGAGNIKLVVKGATTELDGASKALTAGFAFHEQAFPVNPDDSAAWEEADLADWQAGIKIVA